MPHTDPHPFTADARTIRARLLADLTNPSARLVDATIRSQRSGSRRFVFNDRLIGFGAALREVLLNWGVPDRAIYTNDTPVAGYFIPRKFWDFAVRDADGREQVLIELSRLQVTRTGTSPSLSRLCYGLLGNLTDLHFMPRPAFIGLVFVSCNPRGHVRPSLSRRHQQKLERFSRTCRQSGLLDALTYMEVTPDTVADPSGALSLERFLWRLHARLEHLPEDAWEAATVPSTGEGGCGL